MYIYLDWNIFDRIEKIPSLQGDDCSLYKSIENIILSDDTTCPYSNAHLNDLIRGYNKNSFYTQNHLDTLERLTKNLCLCQYWGKSDVTWHYRSVQEFFNTAIEEKEDEAETFEELIGWDRTGLWEMQKSLLRITPVPNDFKKIYQVDPLFNIIYPRTKIDLNMLALCADLYQFSLLVNKDFSLYKSFKRFLIQTMHRLQKNSNLLAMVKQSIQEKPKYLDIDTVNDQFPPKNEVSKNDLYSKIIDVYFRFDLKGYKTDDRFPNMFDDALHTFYGAHCDFFITNDDKCQYKAKKTYERLGINTEVLTAKEFIIKSGTFI